MAQHRQLGPLLLRAGTVARVAGWGVADQALSSITNFALGVVAARSLSPAAFGAYAIAFATYLVALNASRALGAEPFLVRYAGVAEPRWRRGATRATGAAMSVGLIFGAACLAAGLVAQGPLRGALHGLGIVLPGLLLQDAWRYVFIAARRGRDALLNDLVWAVVMIPLVAVVIAGEPSTTTVLLAWGGGAAAAGLFGILQARLLPRPEKFREWLEEQRDLAPRFLGEMGALSGAHLAASYGVGALAKLAAVGALRGAEILFGPVNVLFTGLELVAVPEASRLLLRSPEALRSRVLALSCSLAAIAATVGGVLLLVPDSLGMRLLGSTWPAASSLILPVTVSLAASGLRAGAAVGLRALADARRSLHVRVAVSLLQLSGALGGAALAGALGAAWGNATGSCIAVWLWWSAFSASLKDRGAPSAAAPPTAEGGVTG